MLTNTTIACSRETKKLIDKIMEQESIRTGYKIKSMDIVNRAIRDLADELKVTNPVAVTKSAKKLVRKVKKVNIGKAKWTPAQKAKFKATMAAKRAEKLNETSAPVPFTDPNEFIPSGGSENQ